MALVTRRGWMVIAAFVVGMTLGINPGTKPRVAEDGTPLESASNLSSSGTAPIARSAGEAFPTPPQSPPQRRALGLQGHVVDVDGNPLSHFPIHIQRARHAIEPRLLPRHTPSPVLLDTLAPPTLRGSVNSDETGRVSLPDLPVGVYRISSPRERVVVDFYIGGIAAKTVRTGETFVAVVTPLIRLTVDARLPNGSQPDHCQLWIEASDRESRGSFEFSWTPQRSSIDLIPGGYEIYQDLGVGGQERAELLIGIRSEQKHTIDVIAVDGIEVRVVADPLCRRGLGGVEVFMVPLLAGEDPDSVISRRWNWQPHESETGTLGEVEVGRTYVFRAPLSERAAVFVVRNEEVVNQVVIDTREQHHLELRLPPAPTRALRLTLELVDDGGVAIDNVWRCKAGDGTVLAFTEDPNNPGSYTVDMPDPAMEALREGHECTLRISLPDRAEATIVIRGLHSRVVIPALVDVQLLVRSSPFVGPHLVMDLENLEGDFVARPEYLPERNLFSAEQVTPGDYRLVVRCCGRFIMSQTIAVPPLPGSSESDRRPWSVVVDLPLLYRVSVTGEDELSVVDRQSGSGAFWYRGHVQELWLPPGDYVAVTATGEIDPQAMTFVLESDCTVRWNPHPVTRARVLLPDDLHGPLRPGDLVVAIGEIDLRRPESSIKALFERSRTPASWLIERDGQLIEIEIPREFVESWIANVQGWRLIPE